MKAVISHPNSEELRERLRLRVWFAHAALLPRRRQEPTATAAREPTMGAMVSALVFQPPPPTYGFTRRYFFLATSMYHRIPAFYIPQECVLVCTALEASPMS